MNGGVGRNSGSSSPSPLQSTAPSASASPTRSSYRSRRSRSSHSDTSLPASSSSPTGGTSPSHVRGGEEVQHCPPASLIGQQVSDRPPALPPLGLLQHLRPQNFLLHLPFRTHLEEMISRLRGALAPPALGIRANFCPLVGLLIACDSLVGPGTIEFQWRCLAWLCAARQYAFMPGGRIVVLDQVHPMPSV